MYGQTRILFAIGRDGLLPRAFARVNPRTHTPVNNTVIVAIVVGLLAAFIPLDYLWDLVSIGTLIAFIVVSVGVVILRRTRPDLPRGFKVPGYPVTPVLAVLACLYILSGLHWYTYAWFLLWLSVVLAFYFLWGRKHSLLQRAVEAGPGPRGGPAMTIVVGANPFGDLHGAIDLGITLARTLPEATGAFVLVVATVIPPGWTVPSMARVDGEMQEWVEARADEAKAAVRSTLLAGRADDLTVEFVRLTDRSTPRALAALAEQRDATALVLGSSPDGPEGRVVVGSTADYLLHSSPVPLAIAPRAYRCAPSTTDVAAHRLTCSFSGSGVAASAVRWAARLTREIDVQLRVASFGVRSATMYPPEIGTDIESEVTAQWREQMAEAQAALALAAASSTTTPSSSSRPGPAGREALSSVDWMPNELLVLGSSSAGTLQRVFLGTSATKIIRHSPVPVLVVPRDEL